MAENNTKKWTQSKTVIINSIAVIIAAILAIASAFGKDVALSSESITILATLIGTLLINLALRFEQDKKTLTK